MKMAADMVRPGRVVCDIGTDHAYLPSFLVLNGICPSALACDIGKGPLDNAKKSVQALGLTGKITLRLSDGLDEIEPGEADDFVFCGMGGTLIAELLSRAPWLKNPDKRIIVQPMTHAEDVRLFLLKNGFEIEFENACEDSGHDYAAMRAVYTGKAVKPAAFAPYLGKLPVNDNPVARRILEKQTERLKKHLAGITLGGNEDEAAELAGIISKLSEVLKDAEN